MTHRTHARLPLAAPAVVLLLLLSACGESDTTGPASGTVTVDVEPNTVTATWSLAGPGGYTHDGTGDATLTGLRGGSYTVTWGLDTGYDTPANATHDLADNATVTFTGAYQVTGTVFPDTPDKMAANFLAMYETMNPVALAPLLHPDYVMILQASTTAEFPTVGTTLDPVEEQRIHERMFSRLDLVDPDGMFIPGVQSIMVQTFSRQGAWLESLPNDVIPATPAAVYDVVILLNRGATNSTLKVQGALKLYAAASDSLVDGVPTPYYRLRGVVDLTNDMKSAAGVETYAWGSVKALFR